MNRLLLSALTLATVGVLAACSPSPEEHAQDVAKAQQEADATVAKAQAKAREEQAKAQADLAAARTQAQADVAKANAEAGAKINDATAEANKVEHAADEKVADVQSDALKDDAQARYDLAVSKADADYKVAVEKCAGLSTGGDACKTAAIPRLERATRIFERAFGPSHPGLHAARGQLAGDYEGLHRYADAIPLRLLLLRQTSDGNQQAYLHNALAEDYDATGDTAQAEVHRAEVRRLWPDEGDDADHDDD